MKFVFPPIWFMSKTLNESLLNIILGCVAISVEELPFRMRKMQTPLY